MGVGVLVVGGLLLDMRELVGLAVAVGAVAAMAVALMLGRYARPAWTAVILPALWVVGAVAVGIKTGGFASPRGWIAVAGGAISLLAFWAIGRRRRGVGRPHPVAPPCSACENVRSIFRVENAVLLDSLVMRPHANDLDRALELLAVNGDGCVIDGVGKAMLQGDASRIEPFETADRPLKGGGRCKRVDTHNLNELFAFFL